MVWADIEEEQDDYVSSDEYSIASDSGGDVTYTQTSELQAEDGDSAVHNEFETAHASKKTTEKRKAQDEILRAFAANVTDQLTQKDIQEATSRTAKEEQLSVRDILAKQEIAIRITNPRDYQTELFQKARDENIIAVLDTGSGKTHIATLLLQHILDQELANRAKGGVHKTAFFLVSYIVPGLLLLKLIPRRLTR